AEDPLQIVAQSSVGIAQAIIRLHLEGEIAQGLGNGQGPLTIRDGLVKTTHYGEKRDHIGGDLPESPAIVQGLGEGLTVSQVVEDPSEFSERHEGVSQV